MEWMFVAVLALGIPIAVTIWLIVRAVSSRNGIELLSRRLAALERQVASLKLGAEPSAAEHVKGGETPSGSATTPVVPREVTPVLVAPPPIGPTQLAPTLFPQPPPIPPAQPATVQRPPQPRPVREPAKIIPKINWEEFMGVKLFAWIGGLALFLGVAFFVKYSFDNNLVPPELRVALGFIAGLALLVGGVVLSRKDFAALSQTLCATGVVILYAVTFACRSIYHFEFFGPMATFLLMVLITTTAFLLAVRLDALVVAILGMLGGFLTPMLLSTGQDNPFGLFGYIAILDAGLIVVALHQRWSFLTALAALGTVFMEVGWAGKFFTAERYFDGPKIFIALGVLLGFIALYLAACWWATSRSQTDKWLWGTCLGLAAVAFAFTAWFLTFAPLAGRPWLIFGFAFLVDILVTGLVVLEKEAALAHPIAGLSVFGLLGFWTVNSLRNELLGAALSFYFILAVIHSVVPVFLQRRDGANTLAWSRQIFPPLALLLVLLPIFRLEEVSFLVWPFVLLVDLLAIGLAAVSLSLIPIVVVLVLTLGATGALIFKIPATLTGLPTSFILLGAFTIFFVGVGVWLGRRVKPESFKGRASRPGDDLFASANLAAQLPTLSAILPFLLLIMATLRLPLADPSPVFGLALLLCVLLLGVTRLFLLEWLPAVGLACLTALECAWHFNRFDASRATLPLVWYLVFLGVFVLFPLIFWRQFGDKIVPWATAAMSCPPQFFLIHRLVAAAYPNQVMGLLPAVFAVIPLAGLLVVLKKVPASSPARIAQLAWLGGVALFFITLIFPIQFDRQWITLGWALEGLALLWLFQRLAHPGLRLAGVGLLVAAFIRLAFNPAVLEYHPRSTTPILNWYLYAYGVVTVCLFWGARLLAPPRHQILRVNARSILAGSGTVLAFLLLNIQIADYFSAPGSTLTFQFSGNFARDMTYSIAWALFALVLLVLGILSKTAASRYAALALLSVTLLKLFFHDLANLGQLYRIGAFIGVAVIAMLASFAYQRFFSASLKAKEPKHEIQQTTP